MKLYLNCVDVNGNIVDKDVYDWKLEVFERDNGACRICGNETEVDVHFIDETKGRIKNNGILTILMNLC